MNTQTNTVNATDTSGNMSNTVNVTHLFSFCNSMLRFKGIINNVALEPKPGP